MNDIVWQMLLSVGPPIISMDEQISSEKESKNERCLHVRRKEKHIPETAKNNNNLTEMTTNKRTQSSHEHKQENCLYSKYFDWFSECCTDDLNCCTNPCELNYNKSHKPSSTDTDHHIDCKNLTSKHQQIRISQSSNNQKSALTQSTYDFTISCSNNKCKNINKSSLNVNNIQNCKDVNNVWKRWSIPIVLSQTSIIILIVLSVLVLGTAGSMKVPVDLVTKDGICQSRDIRNAPSELSILKDCRVIEGFLMISLIDRYNETDYDNFTFPKLVEITDFFMLYRVQGLKTLAHLFPNLQVIRGNNLVNNYALIIYEMFQLTEIGLKSLTSIVRGNVRIEKNSMLCFVDTINWVYIANGTQIEDHFFGSNKNVNECPVCPTGKKSDADGSDSGTDIECPTSAQDSKKRYCWNRSTCQKICPPVCGQRSCDDKGNCCDEQCLGSCDAGKPSKCAVCRTLGFGSLDDRRCVDKCPDKLYDYLHRCVSEKECRSIARPFFTLGDTLTNPFIPFNGTCSTSCPKSHAADGVSGDRFCRSCVGGCKIECHGSTIESISQAQPYRGCSRITGSLTIQIRQGGQNVIKELEQALSDIEEIEGSLKVIRSYPLISLNFFRKLEVIRGINIQDNYAMYVMDNQNLQNLFDQPVRVLHGKLFFHFNSKLCYSTIEALKPNVDDLRNVSFINEDVAPNSNGDKVACNLTSLKASLTSLMVWGAVIQVESMKYDDHRALLGYVLHFKQAPFQNVSLYDNRDACGGDGWRVEDVTNFDRKDAKVEIAMTNLKPYTQYAYYVKTYTIASEKNGGQTNISYFRTLPWQPGRIQKLKLTTNGSSSIIVNWEPPKVTNGELTNYIVKATLSKYNRDYLEQRNYCKIPMSQSADDDEVLAPDVVKQSAKDTSPAECECPETDSSDAVPKKLPEESVAENIINFENEIQNMVYVKRTFVVTGETPKDRQRRNIDAASKYSNQTNTNQLVGGGGEPDVFPTSDKKMEKEKANNDFMESKLVNGYYEEFYNNRTNASTHSFVIDKLKHYSWYSVTVQACRDFNDTKFDIKTYCSDIVVASGRTAKIDDADNIESLDFKKVPNSNNSLTTIKLIWPEPKDPNGLIVSYSIVYKRVDLDALLRPTELCLTRQMHVNFSGEYPLVQLPNGNYSVAVRATSLAGDGNLTPPIYILIDESRMSVTTIVFIVLGGLLVLGIIFYAVWFFLRRKFGSPVSDLKLIASVNPEYVGMQYQVDEWEVPRDNVIQLRELGQGSFGMVYEGLVKNKDGENVPCAIKTVNENATDRERINFLKEAGVMKAFDTHHVVRLLGVVSATQPTLVVMELMVNGDLKGYLRSHRPDAENTVQPIAQPPSLKRILQMALEIADGMAYLSAKKFVHRDLAARNCMVADDLTVKIGDFGMTRDIYETDYYRKGTKGLLPVRWMAPESLKDGVFTSSSDVFSYGIVLWEIATGASQPYQGLSNDQVLRYVIDGGVMERPENCPDKLYRLMCRTWQHRPSSRPTFLQIVSMLLDDASPSFRKVSFYHTQEAHELLQHPQNRTMVIDVTTPLKAEEDDFSLDDLAPDAFLMSEVHTRNDGKGDGGASHSPLRSSMGLRRLTSGILDVASSKSNKNSPITTNISSSVNSTNQTHSILGRNGSHLNRGIEFLRNAFFYKTGSNNMENESSDYRKLQTNNETINPINEYDDSITVVGIEDNVGAIKRQKLSNGFVVSDKTENNLRYNAGRNSN